MITEESGIAKGIRRIVAVTGYEAQEVTRIADSLSVKFDLIEKKTGKDKDTALKAFSLVRYPESIDDVEFRLEYVYRI